MTHLSDGQATLVMVDRADVMHHFWARATQFDVALNPCVGHVAAACRLDRGEGPLCMSVLEPGPGWLSADEHIAISYDERVEMEKVWLKTAVIGPVSIEDRRITSAAVRLRRAWAMRNTGFAFASIEKVMRFMAHRHSLYCDAELIDRLLRQRLPGYRIEPGTFSRRAAGWINCLALGRQRCGCTTPA